MRTGLSMYILRIGLEWWSQVKRNQFVFKDFRVIPRIDTNYLV